MATNVHVLHRWKAIPADPADTNAGTVVEACGGRATVSVHPRNGTDDAARFMDGIRLRVAAEAPEMIDIISALVLQLSADQYVAKAGPYPQDLLDALIKARALIGRLTLPFPA